MWQLEEDMIMTKESLNLDTIIFDFDGVLLDSFSDQFELFSKMCRILKTKFPYKNVEEFREDYKEPVYPDMYDFLDLNFAKNKDLIWDVYNEHKKYSKMLMYEGISSMLNHLKYKHLKLAIASSNTKEIIERELKKNNLVGCFEHIVTKEDLPIINGNVALKPDPSCLVMVLEKMGWPKNSLYVGDQGSDIEAVKRANNLFMLEKNECNLLSVATTYGYMSKHNLLKFNPDILVNNVEGIIATVDFLNNDLEVGKSRQYLLRG